MVVELCLVGTITRAHGIAGAVRIASHSDNPGRFSLLRTVLVGADPASAVEMRLVRAVESNGQVLLSLSGCETRNAAESLVGQHVYILEADMLPPPPGTHYVHDLVGCAVLDAAGAQLGRVTDVLLSDVQDTYVIDAGGREVLVPAVPAFILSVDTEARRIVVNTIPGLFDAAD